MEHTGKAGIEQLRRAASDPLMHINAMMEKETSCMGLELAEELAADPAGIDKVAESELQSPPATLMGPEPEPEPGPEPQPEPEVPLDLRLALGDFEPEPELQTQSQSQADIAIVAAAEGQFASLMERWMRVRSSTAAQYCPGPPGRLSALSAFLCKSVFYGAFVWARRELNSQKRRFPARAVTMEDKKDRDKFWKLCDCPGRPGAVKRP
jgi:hypothetical protein